MVLLGYLFMLMRYDWILSIYLVVLLPRCLYLQRRCCRIFLDLCSAICLCGFSGVPGCLWIPGRYSWYQSIGFRF